MKWHESPCGKVWTRTDGACVQWMETTTGKRPWRGSHWHRGQWKQNFGTSNTATAKSAMDGIDFHWPSAMTAKTPPA